MGAAAEAAYVTAPRAGYVIRVDVTSTAARFEIPPGWAGRPCEWVVYGTSGDIAFGLSDVEVEYDAESGVASEVITPDVNTGSRLPDGVCRYWPMPCIDALNTHFSVEGAGTGKLEIRVSG